MYLVVKPTHVKRDAISVANFTIRLQACGQVLFVHKHKAVKLNAKIKDSRCCMTGCAEKLTTFLKTRY